MAVYKKTEVKSIPDDWNCVSIAQIASSAKNSIVGGPFGSDLVSSDYVPSGVPVVRGQNMGRAYVSGEFVFVSIAKAKNLRANTARADDLIFTQRGTLGQISIVPAEPFGEYVVSQSQMKLTLNSDLADTQYVFQYFSSADGQKQIIESAIQTGVPHTNLGILKAYRIPLPPTVAEQHAIAAALSDVDALLDGLDRLIAKKRDLKQAVMQQLLTGQTRLPGFSGEWEVKRLEDVAPLQRGFDLPNPELRSGPYPVVYSNGVLNHHAKFQVQGPGVVTGRSGTIGKVTYVEGPYWPHNTALWVTSFKRNDPRFIFYLYTRIGFDRFATGSGVPTLNRNDVHAFEVALPETREEQTAVATVLSDMDTELAALEARRDKTRALKQAMMQELLTGKTRLVTPTKDSLPGKAAYV